MFSIWFEPKMPLSKSQKRLKPLAVVVSSKTNELPLLHWIVWFTVKPALISQGPTIGLVTSIRARKKS